MAPVLIVSPIRSGFLPPVTNASTIVPQITPVFAVPVLNPVTDFLFQPPDSNGSSPHNPHNDVGG